MFIYTINGEIPQPIDPQADNKFEEIMANFNRIKEKNPNFGLLERMLKEAEEKEEEENEN